MCIRDQQASVLIVLVGRYMGGQYLVTIEVSGCIKPASGLITDLVYHYFDVRSGYVSGRRIGLTEYIDVFADFLVIKSWPLVIGQLQTLHHMRTASGYPLV